jgi:hypothetical protein
MCDVLLPPGVNPTAVKIYISYIAQHNYISADVILLHVSAKHCGHLQASAWGWVILQTK